MSKIIYESELYHHGIIGQKWGIRRFQNKDGSLTAAGRKRVAKLEGELSDLKKDNNDSPPPRKKTVSEMTDAELDAAVNRARKEEAYLQYYAPKQKKKYFDGKEFITSLVNTKGKELVGDTLKYMFGKGINTAFGDEVIKVGKTKVEPDKTKTSTTLGPGMRVEDMTNKELSDYITRKTNEATAKKFLAAPENSAKGIDSTVNLRDFSNDEIQAINKRLQNEVGIKAYLDKLNEKK